MVVCVCRYSVYLQHSLCAKAKYGHLYILMFLAGKYDRKPHSESTVFQVANQSHIWLLIELIEVGKKTIFLLSVFQSNPQTKPWKYKHLGAGAAAQWLSHSLWCRHLISECWFKSQLPHFQSSILLECSLRGSRWWFRYLSPFNFPQIISHDSRRTRVRWP